MRPMVGRWKRILGFGLVGALLAMGLAACSDSVAPEIVATMGDRQIRVEDFNSWAVFMGLGSDPTGMSPELRAAALQDLVRRELVLSEAAHLGIELRDEELSQQEETLRQGQDLKNFEQNLAAHGIDYLDWRRELAAKLLMEKTMELALSAASRVTPEEVRAYYQAHQDEFQHPEQILAEHTVMPDKALAQHMVSLLKKGLDLKQAAEQLGVPLSDNGDPVWLSTGHMPEQLEKEIFSLQPKQTAGPLQSPYGFHVVRVLEKRPAGVVSLAEAAEEIQYLLGAEKKEEQAERWIDGLRSQKKIWINEQFLRTGRTSDTGRS